MNERIKQLAAQATRQYSPTYYTQEWIQGFAELIVRECCIALNPMLRDMISRGQGVDMIKLHFGMNPNKITTAMLDTAIDKMETELAEKKND